MSEIIIENDGQVLVSNLSAEMLEVMKAIAGHDPALEARHRKLRKPRAHKK